MKKGAEILESKAISSEAVVKDNKDVDAIIGEGKPEPKGKGNKMAENKVGKVKDNYTCGECGVNLSGPVQYCSGCGAELDWA